MKRSIIAFSIALLASAQLYAAENESTEAKEQKSSFEYSVFTSMSKDISLGCRLIKIDDSEVSKQAVIRIKSDNYIDLPGSSVNAKLTLTEGKEHLIKGIVTKSTEAEFYYSIEKKDNGEVRDAINAIMRSDNTVVNLYLENGDNVLSSESKLRPQSINALKVINSCGN